MLFKSVFAFFFFFFVIANMKFSGGNIKLDRGLFVSMEKNECKVHRENTREDELIEKELEKS